jgi:acetyltransferase-like isoleucine patch superfamily enzyme
MKKNNFYKIGKNPHLDDFIILGKKNDLSDPNLYIGNNAIIRSFTTIYANTIIGNNFKTGHNVLIRNNCQIGDNVSIGSSSVIEFSVKIENDVRLHSRCFIPEYTELKKGSWLAPGVVITNSKFPNNKYSKSNISPCIIFEKAIVGANVTILPGIKIGKNALIGAGSVVTKDIPEGEVWAGNPAKNIGKKKQYFDYK